MCGALWNEGINFSADGSGIYLNVIFSSSCDELGGETRQLPEKLFKAVGLSLNLLLQSLLLNRNQPINYIKSQKRQTRETIEATMFSLSFEFN